MNDYIDELKTYLSPLTEEEQNEVLEFYSEYLEDSHLTTYKQAAAELGTPKQVARKILADFSIRASEQPDPQPTTLKSNRDVKTIWLIILAIFSTPVAIPIAIVVFALILAVVVTIFAVLFVFVVSLFAVFGAALFTTFIGLTMLSSSLWTALYYIGFGLLIIGAYLIAIPVLRWLFDLVIHWLSIFFKWLYSKLVRDNKAEKRGEQK